MSDLIQNLKEKNLYNPPKWLIPNIVYATITGSVSYGAEDTTVIKSDMDITGICIPLKSDVFPTDYIHGFDTFKHFGEHMQHHIYDPDALGGKGREYDITCYSIVKFFKLLMENNPSCIDMLFTPQECILNMTQVGNLIRENRKLFLHKGCWAKFKGYSYSMLHKMDSKNPQEESNRYEIRQKYGFDVKYAMHVVRLLLEAEQILAEGDLDLQRHKEQLKSIRRGEWSVEKIKEWADTKEKQLEALYVSSTIPVAANKEAVKSLLVKCLELHYGSLKNDYVETDKAIKILREIKGKIEEIEL